LRIVDDFENATSRIGRGQTAPKGIIRVTVAPTFARLHMVSKLPAFFAAYPDMAVEMAASESPATIIEDGFDLAIHSGDLPDSTLVARRFAQTMIILVATPQCLTRYGAPQSPEELGRFDRSSLSGVAPYSRGAFGSGQDAERVIPTGIFRTSDIEQMRMGVLEHLGICPGTSMALRRRTQRRYRHPSSTALSEQCQSSPYGLPPAGCPPSSIFIEHLEKTFALCSQFNPRPS